MFCYLATYTFVILELFTTNIEEWQYGVNELN